MRPEALPTSTCRRFSDLFRPPSGALETDRWPGENNFQLFVPNGIRKWPGRLQGRSYAARLGGFGLCPLSPATTVAKRGRRE